MRKDTKNKRPMRDREFEPDSGKGKRERAAEEKEGGERHAHIWSADSVTSEI